MRTAPRFLLLLAAPLLLVGCDESPTAPEKSLLFFETVFKSSYTGLDAPRFGLIESDAEWARTWQELHARGNERPPVPPVDFSREMVVLAAVGTRSNGCYSVDVTSMSLLDEGVLAVEATETVPGPACGCTQALTQPVHAVKVERVAATASFRQSRRELRC